MRSFHVYCVCCRLLALLLVFSTLAFAENTPPPKISKGTREDIIHAFNEELVYIRTSFPMGKMGLKLRNGNVTPTGPELQHLISLWGPAAKPGDRARISDFVIKQDPIRFDTTDLPLNNPTDYTPTHI